MRHGAPALAALLVTCLAGPAVAATLEGFAKLPALTLMPGPGSGHFIESGENLDLPFDGQPAQGFSAIIPDGNDGYLALVDNGFGNRNNSVDFLLRIYFLAPDFRRIDGGSASILIDGYINLSDPSHHMPYPITADRQCLGAPKPCVPVDPSIRTDRLLTGADLDPESLQLDADGSFWIGDELGPYLLHFDATGVLLEPPFELHGLVSDSRPGALEQSRTLRRSRGFEGMAKSSDGRLLFPMLEGALHEQAGQLNIYSFDLEKRTFINASAFEPSYKYQLDAAATAIGAFKMLNAYSGLVLERDSGEGVDARYKKIFRVDFALIDDAGFLVKTELVDLLNIEDPNDLNNDGEKQFSLPMATPEGLVIIEDDLFGIITDNNFPFGRARASSESGGESIPEESEFILVRAGSPQ